MSWWERIRSALRREAHDVGEAIDQATERGNAAMDRAERELHASPEEKVALEQERIAANDAEYEALKRQIEGGSS